MITLGYKLSSEEQPAADLVRYAQMAEDTGSASRSSRTTSIPGPSGRARAPSCGASSGPSPQATAAPRASAPA